MRLYDYSRSTAAYRVRIALNIKGLDYETQRINLLVGEESERDYLQYNPQGLVPALALDDGTVLHQSLAICEYLDETYPEPPLLPVDPVSRARVRAFAQAICCDIHPLNNLRVLKYLTGQLAVDEAAKLNWYKHWVAEGFTALEAVLATRPESRYCFGETPTLADVCLVAQLFNARRFACDIAPYGRLVAVAERCDALAAFRQAHPAHC